MSSRLVALGIQKGGTEMTFSNWLRKQYACDDAVAWTEGKTPQQAWDICKHGDWMFWLCEQMVGKEGWPTEVDILVARYVATADTVFAFAVRGRRASLTVLDTMMEVVRCPCEETKQTWNTARLAVPYFHNRVISDVAGDRSAWVAVDYVVELTGKGLTGEARKKAEAAASKHIADIAREYLWIGPIAGVR